MKLKRKISKVEFETLTDTQKELYITNGENYILDIEDTAFETLKNEKKLAEEELKKYKDEEQERIKQAEERAEKRAEEKYKEAKDKKDVEALEKSWKDKYSKLEQQLSEVSNKHKQYVSKTLINQTVDKMANEISTSPILLAPHISSRLDVDLTGEEPKLIVLDDKGQRSALTIDELKQSFIDNTAFSAIIKSTTANGGAKAGLFDNASGTQGKTKRLGELSDAELAQFAQAKYGQSVEE